MKKQFYFLSGLPRSGSTLLSAILNQHFDIYVTPTSPLLDLLIENQNAWHECDAVIANPCPQQLTNITKAMIDAMWMHINKPIIIDKNRGWGKNIPASTILFEKEIKVIATVRDLPSIMASWLTLLHNNPNNFVDDEIRKAGQIVNDENRMIQRWFSMVKDCMEGLVQLKKDAANRLLLIDYDDLIHDTSNILFNIEKFLNISHYKYDLNNIISITNDDDLSAWGLNGMHTIRPIIKKISKPAIEILGEDLYNKFVELEKQYK